MKIESLNVGNESPVTVIAGPCVIESEGLTVDIAGTLHEITQRLGINFIFKASIDKANRTSSRSFRGVGLERGMAVLAGIRETGIKVLTDVHEDSCITEIACVVDVLQTPAFLCRQTNFIQKVARAGRPLNIKKGQFLSPGEMTHVVAKATEVGNRDVMVCERGFAFGYNNLVADMRSLPILARTGCPVIFDATHSVQQPGALGGASGGERQFVAALARAAVAVGVAGVFLETHPDPDRALSDGPNMVPLGEMEALLRTLQALDCVVKPDPLSQPRCSCRDFPGADQFCMAHKGVA